MDLSKVSIEELEAELRSRQIPKFKTTYDIESELYEIADLLQRYMEWIASDKYNIGKQDEWTNEIYEKCIDVFIGQKFWEWILNLRG